MLKYTGLIPKKGSKGETLENDNNKNKWDISKTNRKMADINPATSIIILSMNALKTPIKRHKSSV